MAGRVVLTVLGVLAGLTLADGGRGIVLAARVRLRRDLPALVPPQQGEPLSGPIGSTASCLTSSISSRSRSKPA